jgi:hypothetical protein
VDRPVPSRGGPAPEGQQWDEFDFFEFRPSRIGPCGPCGTMNRTNLNRTGSSSNHYLRAISTILESVSSLPHLFGQAEPTLMPIMTRMLTSHDESTFISLTDLFLTFFFLIIYRKCVDTFGG